MDKESFLKKVFEKKRLQLWGIGLYNLIFHPSSLRGDERSIPFGDRRKEHGSPI